MAGKRIYGWFLALVILYEAYSILINLFSYFSPNNKLLEPLSPLLLLLDFSWGLFNLLMIAVLLFKKIEKIALILPLLKIAELVVGITLIVVLTVAGFEEPPAWFSLYGLVFSPVILTIGIVLIRRNS